ncbi:flagellar basal body-associated FliL family protein [Hyphomicrobium sp. D-2]|uniref:flagellar basal body-associated FliL family protein n=1 Tax=Hyphomicrobium sp. D-2 TaxID=3041621 RepID=UPI002453EDEF|nr:flagellar basal body-associated FliL family protein [Hyphomicrobium sp. D-2]MDH4983651.1 flagellar basal body-associated FliL family protein [Hyphomicrobium sp. D-2]
MDETISDNGQKSASLSTGYFLLAVVVLTLAAAGVGFVLGQQLLLRGGGNEVVEQAKPAGYLGERLKMESSKLRPLTPIVTNLAGSSSTWIRIEASLVFDVVPDDADALVARITEDIVAFLRTVPIERIQGASGFQHLSEDLNDRVRARSDGNVREIIIQGLIVE